MLTKKQLETLSRMASCGRLHQPSRLLHLPPPFYPSHHCLLRCLEAELCPDPSRLRDLASSCWLSLRFSLLLFKTFLTFIRTKRSDCILYFSFSHVLCSWQTASLGFHAPGLSSGPALCLQRLLSYFSSLLFQGLVMTAVPPTWKLPYLLDPIASKRTSVTSVCLDA